MTPRHIALALGSLVVLIAGLYLFVEVRSAPAQPPSSPQIVTPAPPPVVAVANDKPAPAPLPPPPPVVEADPPVAPPDDAAVADKPERPQLTNPFRAKLGGIAGKLETAMTEANKAYDRGDMDEARQLAQKILARQPGNERMLRIMVSSSCMDGDAAEAQKYYNQLPPHDRGPMKTRCERYGVTFTDPPTQ